MASEIAKRRGSTLASILSYPEAADECAAIIDAAIAEDRAARAATHLAERVMGCEHCGKPAALVDDRCTDDMLCPWCEARLRPGVFAKFVEEMSESGEAFEAARVAEPTAASTGECDVPLGDDVPAVHLEVHGDVFSAKGTTGDGIAWSIKAEAEREDCARCRVRVDGNVVANISVHVPGPGACRTLPQEVQDVCAALVWSAVRSARWRRNGGPTPASAPGSGAGVGWNGGAISHPNVDVRQVAAALADAAHAGGLSSAYYRMADDALARLAATTAWRTDVKPGNPFDVHIRRLHDELRPLRRAVREGTAKEDRRIIELRAGIDALELAEAEWLRGKTTTPWRTDVEAAPEGVELLIWLNGERRIAKREDRRSIGRCDLWYFSPGWITNEQPTMWQPLPEPPEVKP